MNSIETDTKYCYVLFDGECNLCNGFVDFIVRHDRHDRFRFASLQSDFARRVIENDFPFFFPTFETVLVISHGRLYDRSEAALYVFRQLGFPYSWLWVFRYLPLFIRDRVYDYIASHRYRWFGRRDSCRVPTAAERRKFAG